MDHAFGVIFKKLSPNLDFFFLLFSRSLIDLHFTFRPRINFEAILLCQKPKVGLEFQFFACLFLEVPGPFVEKTIFLH